MRNPQVINLNLDNVMAIDGLSVIDDSTQDELSLTETALQVDIVFWDLNTNIGNAANNKTMTYRADGDIWTVAIVDVAAFFHDRHKYVARVTANAAETADMRPFKFNEFAIDNDSFEDVWMRLPYEVQITPTPKIIWYSDAIGGTPAFEALVYQDGVGTTPATDASRVTHRGPIIVSP